MTIKRIPAAYLILMLSAMVCSCIRPPAEPEVTLQVDSPAPKFKLPSLSGGEMSLDQFKGKIVMLDFWATWCGPCRMTMPLIERFQKEFPNDLVVLAINLQESKDVVSDYVRKQGRTSRVLLDEEGSVGAVYGTESIPMQVLVDKDGLVRHIQIGFSPRMSSQLRAEIQKLR